MRETLLRQELSAVDGVVSTPQQPVAKHVKMCRSPLQFFRGSAQVMYADIASGLCQLPRDAIHIPATRIMGDCHFGNFGFFTEEGSHSKAVVWGPNDFDDAAKAPALWDVFRFVVSIYLVADYLKGIMDGVYTSEDFDPGMLDTPLPDRATDQAVKAFLQAYSTTCALMAEREDERDRAVTQFKAGSFMAQNLKKALNRVPGGKKFATKSTVGKLCQWHPDGHLLFADTAKLARMSAEDYTDITRAFRPWLDDHILDVVRRLGAGTGSANVERFYFLVGPESLRSEVDLALVHVVEAKQQRPASLIRHFPSLHPENDMPPAHLTVDCQRLMSRRPDLVLDECVWRNVHWLIRSRHHARYALAPEDILMARDPAKALKEYSVACAMSLARAHARGDRRSVRFEEAMATILPVCQGEVMAAAQQYAAQISQDHAWLVDVVQPDTTLDDGMLQR